MLTRCHVPADVIRPAKRRAKLLRTLEHRSFVYFIGRSRSLSRINMMPLRSVNRSFGYCFSATSKHSSRVWIIVPNDPSHRCCHLRPPTFNRNVADEHLCGVLGFLPGTFGKQAKFDALNPFDNSDPPLLIPKSRQRIITLIAFSQSCKCVRLAHQARRRP